MIRIVNGTKGLWDRGTNGQWYEWSTRGTNSQWYEKSSNRSGPCYQDCWNTGLLYSSLIAGSEVKGDELPRDGPYCLL